MRLFACFFSLLLILALAVQSFAQQSQAAPAASGNSASPVPRLIKFSGTLLDPQGQPLKGPVGVTFSLYAQQSGDSPLWMETQNVEPDAKGVYTVLLGANNATGLPEELFFTGEARWLGIQTEREAEQPRVLLVSVPYALKAGDAETIGGLPPSASMLASPNNVSITAITNGPMATAAGSPAAASAATVTTTGGTADYLPIFNGASTIIDSVLYQAGTGTTAKVGINTTSPAATLDVKGSANVEGPLTLPANGTATASAGASSQPQKFVASSFSSSITTAVNQTFQWEAEAAANDSASPSATLNLLYGLGATTPSETGLKVNSKGIFTFATGQTFPGSGTITGVTAGTDLTGGGTTGNVTLNLDTTKIPRLAAANIFVGNQAVQRKESANEPTETGPLGN